MQSRTQQGSGCPQCQGRKLCQHNSLATMAPKVAAYWDCQRNSCTADQVLAYSHTPAHWCCSICKHKWIAKTNHRVGKKSGCPQCNAGGLPQANGTKSRTRHPTLTECQHPLLAEWDHQRNAASGLFPHKITLRSSKHVYWLCDKCPSGQEHSWLASVSNRTAVQHEGCPCCAGKAACKCNSLQTHFPAIAAEWDDSRNEGRPDNYTKRSGYLAWWTSPKQGSWQQAIHSRTKVQKRKAARRKAVQRVGI